MYIKYYWGRRVKNRESIPKIVTDLAKYTLIRGMDGTEPFGRLTPRRVNSIICVTTIILRSLLLSSQIATQVQAHPIVEARK